jgi:hypothetical protein
MKLKFLLVAMFIAVANARGDVVNLGAVQDTSIFKNSTGNSDGGGAGLFSGTDSMSHVKRALIEFNVSSIPAGATITNVQLTLTLGMSAGGVSTNTATIGLYDVLDSWGEGTTGNPTQNPGGISGSGNGFTAGTGDATWNSRFNSSTAWTTAGGDHSSTTSASLFLNNSATGAMFTWSTAQMVSDVQGWLNNPSTNDGWELINADETDATTFFAFYSREWASFSGGNASQEPVLQVTYAAPEPTTGILFVGACLGSLSLRPLRRRS